MSTDTVQYTESDFRLALQGVLVQSKASGVEFSWEVHDFLIVQAENMATHEAWMRFYNRLLKERQV